MSFGQIVLWGAETVIFMAVIFAVQIPLRKRNIPVAGVIVFILKLVMILGMALLFAALETPISYTHGEVFAAW